MATGTAAAGHKASATAVAWYAVDNGLFASASKDATVKLWDPNAVALVASFEAAANVGALAAGPAASNASLMAAACADACVRLIDVRQGSAAQTLSGASAFVPARCALGPA